LNIARAIENQMFVIGCNRVGGNDTTFFGHSMVTDPWGEVIGEAADEETLLVCDISLPRVDEIRSKIPVFADRRPEVYTA
jgi:predicted amidohydrolase